MGEGPGAIDRMGVQSGGPTGRRMALFVVAFFPMWLIGIGFLWWPLIAVLELQRQTTLHTRGSTVPRLIRVLALVLTISLLANIAGGGVTFGRAAGAVLAILIWASVAIVAVRWSVPGARPYLVLGLGVIGGIQGILSGIAALLHPSPMSVFPSLVGEVAGQGLGDSGLSAWLMHDLAYDDFFGFDEVVRSAGMMASAAWSGGFAGLAAVALAACAGPIIRLVGGRRWVWVALLLLNLVSVFLSYTRLTWGLTALGLVAVLLGGVSRLILGDRAYLMLVPGILLAVATFLVAPPLDASLVLTDLDELRPDSSAARLTSYTLGIEMTTGGDPSTQLFGFGAKPVVASLPYGVGSESTYVSVLVRGGAVALLVLITALLLALKLCIQRADWEGGLLLVLLAAHSAVEDLDVGTLTPLVLVALLAPPAGRSALRDRASGDGRPRGHDVPRYRTRPVRQSRGDRFKAGPGLGTVEKPVLRPPLTSRRTSSEAQNRQRRSGMGI